MYMYIGPTNLLLAFTCVWYLFMYMYVNILAYVLCM
jgi:hypothetical protein